MEYRRLGKSGLQVSALSFGSWVTFGSQIGDETAEACMIKAYEAGVNFFDNAEIYASGKSEEVMGRILKKLAWDRSTYVVSSKVFWGGPLPNQIGLSRKRVFEACHAALRRMQVDYLDMYFCHRPDKNTPVEETVRAMHDLVSQGKVLYWGTSEWSASQIMEAWVVAKQYGLMPPSMEQPQYNMFHRERVEVEYSRLYSEFGMGTTIWSPLASGLLTGKYNNAIPADTRIHRPGMEWLKEKMTGPEAKLKIEKAQKLEKLAAEFGLSLTHMALTWCLKNPAVSTVITGASKASQVTDNMKAMDVYGKMSDELMQKIEAVLANKPQEPGF
jgi:voltage-dependent potassium channel beta subunit